jgi:hypothetical protein
VEKPLHTTLTPIILLEVSYLVIYHRRATKLDRNLGRNHWSGNLLRLVYMWVRMSIFYKSSLKENGRIIPVRHLERAKRE